MTRRAIPVCRHLRVVVLALVLLLPACNTAPTAKSSPPLSGDAPPILNATATVAVIVAQAEQDSSAHASLVLFFEHLHAGRYEEASRLYGGSYQTLIDQNPAIDPDDSAALLRNACTQGGFQCLEIRIAGIDRKPSPAEYVFVVQFKHDDGSVFVQGPCCGESDAVQPPVSYFEIRVAEIAEHEFRVLDLPPYLP